MAIAGVQASFGLRYVIMLRPRLQIFCVGCAGVRYLIIYSSNSIAAKFTRKEDGTKLIMRAKREQKFRTTPIFGRPHPLWGDRGVPRPLNIEIYRPKFDSIQSLEFGYMFVPTPIYAIERNSGTYSGLQSSCDIGYESDVRMRSVGRSDSPLSHVYEALFTLENLV